MINSPRSLEACHRIGVQPSELYQLSEEQFKKKYPDLLSLSQKLIQYRYDAEEKFRKETVEQAKQERKKIIEEKNKEKDDSKTNKDASESNNNRKIDDTDKKWEKIIENEKKAIEKVKQRQRQNIE